MIQSLATLFNRKGERKKTPIQWNQTKIKSLYKVRNKDRMQEIQKIICLMNIVCKVFERVKKLQNENKQANISSMENAVEKKR